MTEYQRSSTVDGYTIVYRTGRAAKIHLLRAWNSCNTERGKSGRDTVVVQGSRENLLMALEGKRAVSCKRCFPAPAEPVEPDVVEPVYVDPLEEYDS